MHISSPHSATIITTHPLTPPPLPPQDGCVSPLHDKRQQRTFPPSYAAFWSKLVSELHSAALLLDESLMDRLNALLIALSWWVFVGARGGGDGYGASLSWWVGGGVR